MKKAETIKKIKLWSLKKNLKICDDNFFTKIIFNDFKIFRNKIYGYIMDTKTSKNEQNEEEDFFCEKCDYKCFKKYNYDRHLSTDRHTMIHFGYILDTQNEQNEQKSKIDNKNFICNCGKEYKYSQGLSKHKSFCKSTIPNAKTNDSIDKELIMLLIKENSDLKNMVLDVCQKIQPLNNTIKSHNVTNNKTFNLNVFLNETCKDAMNIMDFVDSLKLQLSDLETVGKLGFVDGISNIIVKNLNSLEETKRPIHCTDAKREVLYVKDEDKWEKEEIKNTKIRKAIKHIAHKNSKILPEFKKKHPDCGKSESKFSDQYNKLIIEAMGGHGDNDLEKEDKIIKNIAKEVIIDKTYFLNDEDINKIC